MLNIMRNYYNNKITQYADGPSEIELDEYAQETGRLDNLRRNSLEDLHENISVKIQNIFGKQFLELAKAGRISAEESINANVILANALYSNQLLDSILIHNIKAFEDLSDDNLQQFVSNNKSALSKFLESSGVQLLIVRPEMYHLHQKIGNFLEKEGLDIIASIDKTLSFEQYWAMYKDNIFDKNAFADFPTRTLLYLSGKCRLIIFLNLKDVNLPKLKGERGVYIPHTIRGDLITKESLYLLRNNIVDPKKLSFILDPIGCYRGIISGDTPSDNIHKKYKYPFFFYAIAGIHMPDNEEIQRELQILLGLEEIEEIVKKTLSTKMNKQVKSLDLANSGESFTYFVDLGEKRNYLKIKREGQNNNFAFEAYTLKLLNSQAANVSKPIEFGSNYLLQSEVEGESINDKPELFLKQSIYDVLAKDLNKFYNFDFDGFGRVEIDGDIKAEYDNWEGFINEIDVWVDEINNKNLVAKSLVDSLYETWTLNKGKILKINKSHLVHGDFCLDHIYSSKGQYSGIIDFGDAFAGDPLMDLAYFKFKEITKNYGPETYRLLIDAYSKFRKFDENDNNLVDLYMIYWALKRVREAKEDDLISKFTEKMKILEKNINI